MYLLEKGAVSVVASRPVSNRYEVTIVIVNWNGEKFLEQCLAALMAQTVKPFEIILVDNASSDRSLDIVDRFPSVRVLKQTQNTGFARGNNLAIAAAVSEWVVLLNPDAFVDSCWLEELVKSAKANPEFDVFGSQLINAGNSTLLDGTGDVYHISGLVWRTAHGMPVNNLDESEREIFAPCAAAAMYRRSAVLKVEGFDEDFFCYTEDVDLGFRLRLAGYRCLYVPLSRAYHVGSGTTGGKGSDFSLYHGHRNLVWMFFKNMPSLLFVLLLPLHLVLNLVSIIWFTLYGRGRVILRAKRDALKGLPRAWSKRKAIQANRVSPVSEIWRCLHKGWR